MIGAGLVAWLVVGAAVAALERDHFIERDRSRWEQIDAFAAMFVLAILWPGVLALKALVWLRRR